MQAPKISSKRRLLSSLGGVSKTTKSQKSMVRMKLAIQSALLLPLAMYDES
jgi:hypothetical protein